MTWFVALLLLGTGAFAQEEYEGPSPEDIPAKYQVVFLNEFSPSTMTVLERGKVIAAFSGPKRTIVRETSMAEHDDFDASSMSARVALACGDRELPLRAVLNEPDSEEASSKMFRDGFDQPPYEVVVDYQRLAHLSLTFDNRGVGGKTLSLGRLKLKIAGKESGNLNAPAPDCPEGAVLKLDGAELGKVPTTEALGKERWKHLFVDLSLKRCYEWKTVNYATKTSAAFMQGAGRESGVLSGGAVYETPPFDHLLEHAPGSVEMLQEGVHASLDIGTASRREIVELPCK